MCRGVSSQTCLYKENKDRPFPLYTYVRMNEFVHLTYYLHIALGGRGQPIDIVAYT